MSDRNEWARRADQSIEALQVVLDEAPGDVVQATELARKIGAYRTNELVRFVRSIVQVNATLTSSQREALKKL